MYKFHTFFLIISACAVWLTSCSIISDSGSANPEADSSEAAQTAAFPTPTLLTDAFAQSVWQPSILDSTGGKDCTNIQNEMDEITGATVDFETIYSDIKFEFDFISQPRALTLLTEQRARLMELKELLPPEACLFASAQAATVGYEIYSAGFEKYLNYEINEEGLEIYSQALFELKNISTEQVDASRFGRELLTDAEIAQEIEQVLAQVVN